MLKETLRKKYTEIRGEIPHDIRVMKSTMIWKYFCNLSFYKDAKMIMTYVNTKSEVTTYQLIPLLLAQGKRVCVPKCIGDSLVPYEITELPQLSAGNFGVLEPSQELIDKGVLKEVPKDEIDISVCPGLAFDFLGYRLGYGKGYYDRFLKDFQGIKIGFSFDSCLCPEIETHEFDIPMNIIITESGVEYC